MAAPETFSVATVAETREVERQTSELVGVPLEALMERAALGVAAVVARVAQGWPGEEIAILAGTGHNGGDAAACARILASWGFAPVLHVARGERAPAVEAQVRMASGFGVSVRTLSEFTRSRVVVDGLLGFGLNRSPTGEIAAAIDRVNEATDSAIVAIDLPSGTHGDTGVAPGRRVIATHTVATGLLKLGAACDPAADAVGELWQADLGFPPALLKRLAGRILTFEPPPARKPSIHKGTAGTAIVIGGSAAMSGAPGLAAQAAYRAGAGLVVALVPGSIRDAVAMQVPEALVVPLPECDGQLDPSAFEAISPYLERATAVAMGPGLGAGAGELVRRIWVTWQGPLLVDADGLLAELAELPRAGATVLTPHPGEAGRLLGRSAGEIQVDRLTAARSLADRFGAVAALKGARTVVARPNGSYGVLLRTTPALATAGSGDVLAGLVVGLLAQGFDAGEAAGVGVALHAELGLRAAVLCRPGGLMARDLLNCCEVFKKPSLIRAGALASRLV